MSKQINSIKQTLNYKEEMDILKKYSNPKNNKQTGKLIVATPAFYAKNEEWLSRQPKVIVSLNINYNGVDGDIDGCVVINNDEDIRKLTQ